MTLISKLTINELKLKETLNFEAFTKVTTMKFLYFLILVALFSYGELKISFQSSVVSILLKIRAIWRQCQRIQLLLPGLTRRSSKSTQKKSSVIQTSPVKTACSSMLTATTASVVSLAPFWLVMPKKRRISFCFNKRNKKFWLSF